MEGISEREVIMIFWRILRYTITYTEGSCTMYAVSFAATLWWMLLSVSCYGIEELTNDHHGSSSFALRDFT